jgi:hypothetical protein
MLHLRIAGMLWCFRELTKPASGQGIKMERCSRHTLKPAIMATRHGQYPADIPKMKGDH